MLTKVSFDMPQSMYDRIQSLREGKPLSSILRLLVQKALDLPLYQDRFSIQQMEIQSQKMLLDIQLMKLEVEAREKELQGMLTTLENIKNTPVPETPKFNKFNPHNQTDEEFQESLHVYLAETTKKPL